MNKHLYLDFQNNEREEINSAYDFVSDELSEDSEIFHYSEIAQKIDDSRAKLKDNRLEGKFVCQFIATTTYKVINFTSFKRT